MIVIQARNFTPASRRKIDLVVIHTMEAPEKPNTAEAVATWFASAGAPQASAHYCIDATTIVQCVLEKDVAWHAPGANHQGIGLEHAGFARQSPEEWADTYSEAMLRISAGLTADICARYAIPIEWVDAAGLKLGKRGITSHAACTDAWSAGKGHWDPGPHFPIAHYLELVSAGAVPSDDTLSTVRSVQTALARLGFEPGPVDGLCGPRMRASVMRFQQSRGLKVDGVVGPVTRSSLACALADAVAPTQRDGTAG